MSTENICPHCGFKAHDDEICNACGKLIHDDLPQKSFRQVVREVGTELKEMGFQGDTHTVFSNDEDFGMLPGEIGYNLYNDEMY